MSIALHALLAAVLVAWLVMARVFVRMWALLGRDLAPVAPGAITSKLSIVVACRNEAAMVERAVASMLEQNHPALELVVVDDRSTDGTGQILERLAARDPRLTVVHVSALPEGWLGKTHALDRGAAAATGDWLLFTDADIVFAPDALSRSVAWAERNQLGHAVVMPHFHAPGYFERSFVSAFGLFLIISLKLDQLERAGSRAFVGVGAFNLVRAEAYRAIGGHVGSPSKWRTTSSWACSCDEAACARGASIRAAWFRCAGRTGSWPRCEASSRTSLPGSNTIGRALCVAWSNCLRRRPWRPRACS